MKLEHIVILLCVAACVAAGWKWQEVEKQLVNTNEQIAQLEDENKALRAQVQTLEVALEEADSKSLEGLIKETNKQLFNGLEGLIDSFKNEIDKAKDEIEKTFEEEFENDYAPNGDAKTST